MLFFPLRYGPAASGAASGSPETSARSGRPTVYRYAV